jgi:hypothetical protein
MARNELFFSRLKLLFLGCCGLFGGLFLAAGAMEVQAGGRVRGLGFLRLPGQDFPYFFAVTVAVLGIIVFLAAIRRLAGGRVAAAIRYDGIELRGLFLSRYIPWRSLDGLFLRTTRYSDKVHYAIRIKSSCPRGANALHHFLANLSRGVGTGLFAASDEEMIRWLADAEAARRAALGPPRQPAPPRVAVSRPKIGFGRRMG